MAPAFLMVIVTFPALALPLAGAILYSVSLTLTAPAPAPLGGVVLAGAGAGVELELEPELEELELLLDPERARQSRAKTVIARGPVTEHAPGSLGWLARRRGGNDGPAIVCRALWASRGRGRNRTLALRPAGTPFAGQADVDLPFDVVPLLGVTQPLDELREIGRGIGRELKPGQEVKRLAEVSPVVESSGDGGQVFEADGHVVGALLEDLAAFVLGKLPPGRGLPDRDQRRARRVAPTQRRLARLQLLTLGSRDVALVAGDAAKDPGRI